MIMEKTEIKKPFMVDVPVALIFFNRPDLFKQVFEAVKRNRPSQLFLIQDGPRDTKPQDLPKVMECREIASHIDWDCDVIMDYSEVNMGCGRRIFSGLTNAFKKVDRLVIIEDDIVIADSFLPLCKLLLEKYKDDERINSISGMNHFGVYEDCPYSYFFSRGGAIWGWATWKRVWDDIDWNLEIIEDPYIYKTMLRNGTPYRFTKGMAEKAKTISDKIKTGGAPSFWSFHFLLYSYLESRFNIVPKYNQISNIGCIEGTHTQNTFDALTDEMKSIYFAKRYEIDLDLIHPKVVFEDRYFKEIQDELMRPTGFHRIKEITKFTLNKIKTSLFHK